MRILIIDDSDEDAIKMARLIGQQGHESHAVRSMDSLPVDVGVFDLALVDLWMPGYEPEATMEAAKLLSIPYVIVTGDTNPAIARKIGRLGIGLVNKSSMNFEEMANHAFGLAEAANERRALLEQVRNLKIFDKLPEG